MGLFLLHFFGTVGKTEEFFFYILFPAFIGAILYYAFRRKYSPIVCYFIGFILQWIVFLNVNPYPIEMDNKYAVMKHIPEKYRPDTQFLLSDILNQSYSYPMIIKPILCSGKGNGIVIVRTQNELKSFLQTCKNTAEYMVQNYLDDYMVEIGVLYEHSPLSNKGNIFEIYEKTQTDEIRYWIQKNAVDQSHLITPELNAEFDRLSANIPGFCVGRYDIRLRNLGDLQKMDFKILEVNGTMGMSLNSSYNHVYYTNMCSWYLRRLFTGVSNIVTFRGYSPVHLPMAMMKSYYAVFRCDDWENLFSLYS
jgi:hypothetical protein